MAESRRFKEPDAMRRDARSYTQMLVRVKQMSMRSMLHDDKMLTWLASLMGAGLLALPTVVSSACPGKPAKLYLVAGAWAAGILVAATGRIVAAWHRDADDVFYTAKLSGMRKLLISDVPDLEFSQRYAQIVEDEDPPVKRRFDIVKRYQFPVRLILYVTMASFVVGVLAIYVRISLC